jgi:WD40 repeat protein
MQQLQDLEGQDVHMWDFARSQINDLVVSPNGQWLIVITQEKRIRLYDIQKGEKERYGGGPFTHSLLLPPYQLSLIAFPSSKHHSLEETDAITSLSVSDDSRYLLVNVASQEVHLWDLDSRALVQKYWYAQRVLASPARNRSPVVLCLGSHVSRF